MLETPAQNSNTPVRSSGFVGRVGLIGRHVVRRIPRKTGVVVLIGAVLLAVLRVHAYLAGGSAVLNLVVAAGVNSFGAAPALRGAVVR
jgi:hypothetical protein